MGKKNQKNGTAAAVTAQAAPAPAPAAEPTPETGIGTSPTADKPKRGGNHGGGIRPWKERTLASLAYLVSVKAPGATELNDWIAKNIAEDFKLPGTQSEALEVDNVVNLTMAARAEYRGILGDKVDGKWTVAVKERGYYKVKQGDIALRLKRDELSDAE